LDTSTVTCNTATNSKLNGACADGFALDISGVAHVCQNKTFLTTTEVDKVSLKLMLQFLGIELASLRGKDTAALKEGVIAAIVAASNGLITADKIESVTFTQGQEPQEPDAKRFRRANDAPIAATITFVPKFVFTSEVETEIEKATTKGEFKVEVEINGNAFSATVTEAPVSGSVTVTLIVPENTVAKSVSAGGAKAKNKMTGGATAVLIFGMLLLIVVVGAVIYVLVIKPSQAAAKISPGSSLVKGEPSATQIPVQRQSDTQAWLGAAIADADTAPPPPQATPGLVPDVASIIVATNPPAASEMTNV